MLIKIIKLCFILIIIKYVFFFNNNIIRNTNNIIEKQRKIYDVLFINGYNSNSINQFYHNRVLNQVEQLKSSYLQTFEVYISDFNPLIVRDFRIIIFYHCLWSEKVDEAIKLGHNLNKKIIFDIDDLMIDDNYTNSISNDIFLSNFDTKNYNVNIFLMRKTLSLCDSVITSSDDQTQRLKKIVNEVFVNYNVISEEMFRTSEKIDTKKKRKYKNNIIIGYFSESYSNKNNIEIIVPVLVKILSEHKNILLFLIGKIDIPETLTKFYSRIIRKPYIDYQLFPKFISNIDINIVPFKKNIFNEVRNENNWIQASLLKIPTIASNLSSFNRVIENGYSGFICNNIIEWYNALSALISNKELRDKIGINSYNVCRKEYNTITTGYKFFNYLNSFSNKHIGFIVPKPIQCGGIRVIFIHAAILQDKGWDVDFIVSDYYDNFIKFEGHKFNVINFNNTIISTTFDILVATLFSTLDTIMNYIKVKRKLYLVQGYETLFSNYGYLREAEKTYTSTFGIEYITISKWCKTWLENKYKQKVRFAHNGINMTHFFSHKRNLNNTKIRVLIEGNYYSDFKNVDESFKIAEKLDKNRFEIWYMSSVIGPKDWYRVDKFISNIAYEEVGKIYQECDILIKSSLFESFSYPPLEMMATGGYCILVPNNGNIEYLKHKENCLFYQAGNIDSAIQCIELLISNQELQNHLYENGLATARNRNLEHIKEEIIDLYEK
jgi:glycosyltransferase involved in cell wall biosynthesis